MVATMQIKDLGYEFTGIPGIEKITVTRHDTGTEDGSYVAINVKPQGGEWISFDVEGWADFTAAIHEINPKIALMNASVRTQELE